MSVISRTVSHRVILVISWSKLWSFLSLILKWRLLFLSPVHKGAPQPPFQADHRVFDSSLNPPSLCQLSQTVTVLFLTSWFLADYSLGLFSSSLPLSLVCLGSGRWSPADSTCTWSTVYLTSFAPFTQCQTVRYLHVSPLQSCFLCT